MPVPSSSSSVGPLLVGLGLVLVVAGVLAWSGALSWFGRLPGDIRLERGPVRLYAPLASMLIVSVVLTVVAALARRLFR
jgi:hypothetical protein